MFKPRSNRVHVQTTFKACFAMFQPFASRVQAIPNSFSNRARAVFKDACVRSENANATRARIL
eukprot:7825068-Lingulodinium_polyedra.AAC.1